MPERSRDWMEQAERDLASARLQMAGGFWEWACFASHQAAVKGLKAVYLRLGGEAWGHALRGLVEGLRGRVELPEEVGCCAEQLDRFYVPTRYPNAWPEGSPGGHFRREDAEGALRCAETILRFCHRLLAGS